MNQHMTHERLRKENLIFAGTGGVSEGNRSSGFVPGFCDTETGVVQISRFRNGSPAPMHLLEGLPDEWVNERDSSGRITALKASVVAGFIRQDRFYTREQAAKAVLH
jgi:hypothetical protein